jgi:DNA-binding PadR family transcriptional regulator
MSLKHALLGVLSLRPATGYELKGFFERSIHHFWNADLSQIYRALDEIKSEGLATVRIEPQESKPPRHVYFISEKGKDELVRWLREPVKDMPTFRNPLLVKVFFGALSGKADVIRHLQGYQERIQQKLDAYATLNKEGLARLTGEPHGRGNLSTPDHTEPMLIKEHLMYAKATLRLGIKIAKVTSEWCTEIMNELQAPPERKSKKSRR